MTAMGRHALLSLAITIAAIALLLAPGAVAEEKRIEVIRTDSSYQKDAKVGETQSYIWTVANINEKNQSYRIEISASAHSGWDIQVSPGVMPELKAGDVGGIMLSVTPRDASEDMLNVTLTVIARQNGTIVFRSDQNAVTTIIKPPAAPSEKLWLGMFHNPLSSPLDNDYGVFVLDALTWIGIALVVVLILDPFVKAFTAKTKTQVDDIILATIKIPLFVWLVLLGTQQSFQALDQIIPLSVLDYVNQTYNIVLVFILFYIGYRLFKNLVVYYAKEVSKRTESKLDDILIPVVEKLGVVVLAFIALGYLLSFMNIDLTMFVAGGVVISMVIAFAAQETLSNFFSGLFILLERPFKEGDTILLPGDEWCDVRTIGLRRTTIFRHRDATLISVPNNKIANEYIANFTSPEDEGKYSFTVGAGYDSDPDKVKKILRDIIKDCPHIVKDKKDLEPVVRFDAFGDSSLNFFVLVWVTHRKYRMDVKDFLNTEILKRFAKAGIDIPYPQQVVHLKDANRIKEGK